jgi:hypothetical protein
MAMLQISMMDGWKLAGALHLASTIVAHEELCPWRIVQGRPPVRLSAGRCGLDGSH